MAARTAFRWARAVESRPLVKNSDGFPNRRQFGTFTAPNDAVIAFPPGFAAIAGRLAVVSAGAAERYDADYLQKRLPADGSVTLRNITSSRGCFVLAGPRSRDVLAKLTDAPLDNGAFPWLSSQVLEVGLAVDVLTLRVNFVG